MIFATLSDIHGNSWALEAVLGDLEDHHPDLILNLGDSFYGPLDPAGTFDLLRSKEIISVAGNEDRFILENLLKITGNPTLDYTISRLNPESISWLRSLPFTKIISPAILLCHGTPFSDTTYLLEYVEKDQIRNRTEEQLEDLLKDIGQKIIFCGHSHLPGIAETKNHTIINPGSVGLQSYDDDHPVLHKVENNDPLARYCLVEITSSGITVEHKAVPYDFEKAAICAEKNQRKDWAGWLRNGM